jgi:hypothetical protein
MYRYSDVQQRLLLNGCPEPTLPTLNAHPSTRAVNRPNAAPCIQQQGV